MSVVGNADKEPVGRLAYYSIKRYAHDKIADTASAAGCDAYNGERGMSQCCIA